MRGAPTVAATASSTPDPTLPPTDTPTPEPAPQTGWRHRAACRDLVSSPETDVFFTPDGREAPEDTQERELRALSVCEGCPVQAECLDFAVSTRQPWGVWGGRTEAQLQQLIVLAAGRPAGWVQSRIDRGLVPGVRPGPDHPKTRKTHCPQGHPYDETNTYRTKAGRRQCRACMRIRALQQQAQLTAQRTHCPVGHPYDETNTEFTAHGRRKCRACARARALAESSWHAQQRARRTTRGRSS